MEKRARWYFDEHDMFVIDEPIVFSAERRARAQSALLRNVTELALRPKQRRRTW